jgi:type IV pilus assembly protein PilP
MTSRNSWRKWLVAVSSLGAFSLGGTPCQVHGQEYPTEDMYHYAATGKRDPFFPPFRTTESERVETDEPKTPLQRFDIGQLKLVGVIWEAEEPKALIEDSGGLGYIVTRGTLIGSRGGVVKTIEPKRITIEEYQTDFFGKQQTQERELRLVVTDSPREKQKKQEP